MKITGTKMLASAASVLLFGAMACAQSSGMSANSQSGTNGMSAQSGMNGIPAADKRFMDKAAQGGMAEVELGHLAEQNGSSQQVKDFGKRMVNDHSKANDQLKQLASKENVTLPTSLDAKDQATKDRLSKLQGAAFDKAYMKDMVMDHKKDVADFKHESMDAKNPQAEELGKPDFAGLAKPSSGSREDCADYGQRNGHEQRHEQWLQRCDGQTVSGHRRE